MEERIFLLEEEREEFEGFLLWTNLENLEDVIRLASDHPNELIKNTVTKNLFLHPSQENSKKT